MLKRETGGHMKRMMAVTTFMVFVITFVVIGAFASLQKRQERQISAAGTTRRTDAAAAPGKAGSEAAVSEETNSSVETEQKEAEETVVAVISSEGTGDEAETEIYLVTGDKKGSSKYDRADRLSYTDSVRYTAEAVELLDRYGLRITRNEIYARHGRMFNDQDMQDYFNRQAWYVPRTSTGSFDESCLNEIETYNVKLIRSYELKQGY